MSNMPPSRPKLSAVDVRTILKAKVPTLRDKVAVVGIRGYYSDSMGKPGQNDRSIYDDAAFVVLSDRVVSFNFNTDPSAFRTGMATLIPGVYRFIAGWHKIGNPSGHAAFRQHGPVTVSRDNVGFESGSFGINLHMGGNSGTSSLGCQTVPREQWSEFRSTVYGALGIKVARINPFTSGLKDATVTYVLVTKAEAEKIIGRAF
jgi:lysozyme